jgi:transcriptional regulator with XRE-family HTH domain
MLGDYLKSLRTSSRISSNSLANQAGIARNTISRWENGINVPHIPELEAVLDAIRATRQERQRALELLPATRGTKALNAAYAETHQLTMGWGEVLWALRLRKAWTLEQLAASLNIRHSTIARWERGETWPGEAQLLELCSKLGAHEVEITALISGRFSVVDPSCGVQDRRRAIEAFESKWHAIDRPQLSPNEYALFNLHCVACTAQGQFLLSRYPEVRPIVSKVMRAHTRHFSLAEIQPAAERVARRLVQLSDGYPELSSHWLYAKIMIARAKSCGAYDLLGVQRSSYQNVSARAKLALNMLIPLTNVAASPGVRAWLHSEIARMHARTANQAASLAFAQRACEIAKRADNPKEMAVRKGDLAAIHLYFNDPQEALDGISYDTTYDLETGMYTSLLHAVALARLGKDDEAKSHLTIVEQTMLAYRFDHLHSGVCGLSERN